MKLRCYQKPAADDRYIVFLVWKERPGDMPGTSSLIDVDLPDGLEDDLAAELEKRRWIDLYITPAEIARYGGTQAINLYLKKFLEGK